MTLSGPEASRIRRYFTNALWVKGEANFYWLPKARRAMSFGSGCTRLEALPRSAILIGLYRHPCDPFDFLDDLYDAIRRIEQRAA